MRIITDMMKNQESDYEKKDRRFHVTFATCYHRGGFSNWRTGQVDDSKNTLKYIFKKPTTITVYVEEWTLFQRTEDLLTKLIFCFYFIF